MEENRISIDWSQYGAYEMVLDVGTMTMSGCKKGQPENWRKATFIRSLGSEGVSTIPAHDHGHNH
jgi:hypothetical protein